MKLELEIAWSKMKEAAILLFGSSSARTGLPIAWCDALGLLKRDHHIPVCVREDFAFLTNEMGCCLEVKRAGGRLEFMDGVTDERIACMVLAFQRIYSTLFTLTVLQNLDEDTTLIVRWLEGQHAARATVIPDFSVEMAAIAFGLPLPVNAEPRPISLERLTAWTPDPGAAPN